MHNDAIKEAIENRPKLFSKESLNEIYEGLEILPLFKIIQFKNTLQNQIEIYENAKSTVLYLKGIDDTLNIQEEAVDQQIAEDIDKAKKKNDLVSVKKLTKLIEKSNKEEVLKEAGIEDMDKFLEEYDEDVTQLRELIDKVDTKIKEFGTEDDFAKTSFISNQMILSINYDKSKIKEDDLNYDMLMKKMDMRIEAINNRLNHDVIINKLNAFLKLKDTKKLFLNYEKNGKHCLDVIHSSLLRGESAAYSFSKVLVDILNRYGNDTSILFTIFISRFAESEKRSGKVIYIKLLLLNLMDIFNMKNPKGALEKAEFDLTDDLDTYEKYVEDNIILPLKEAAEKFRQ